jgi:hypothetical protein
VIYLRSGSCASGSQVGCNDDASGCAASSSSTHASRLTPMVTAGQTYYIFVDGYQGASGSFSLSVTPPSTALAPPTACTSPTVVPPAGGVFTGTTSGSSSLTGTCAATGSAPERVFQWTPATSGPATIQTCGAGGTNFDTVLYMRTGTCQAGSQAACNDDTSGCSTGAGPGMGSRIRPNVTAGQTYFIVVDGYASSEGDFTFSITQP